MTVTVDVTGGGVDDPLLELPHPLSRVSPNPTVANNSKACKVRRLFNPTQKNRSADNTQPVFGNGRTSCWLTLLATAVAETVSAVVIAAPDGVTADGEKLHDVPDG